MRVFLVVGLVAACGAPRGGGTDAAGLASPAVATSAPTPEGPVPPPPSPAGSGASDDAGLSAARACFASPLVFDPRVAPKPLPAHVTAWLAEIDAAAPEVAPSGAAMLRVRLSADEARPMLLPEEDMRFAAARTFFEHMHWADAGLRFRALAVREPPGSTGIFAAQLYLECLNVVHAKSRPARPACLDAMVSDSERFLTLHCRSQPGQNLPEACDVLEKIPAQVAHLRGGP